MAYGDNNIGLPSIVVPAACRVLRDHTDIRVQRDRYTDASPMTPSVVMAIRDAVKRNSRRHEHAIRMSHRRLGLTRNLLLLYSNELRALLLGM